MCELQDVRDSRRHYSKFVCYQSPIWQNEEEVVEPIHKYFLLKKTVQIL